MFFFKIYYCERRESFYTTNPLASTIKKQFQHKGFFTAGAEEFYKKMQTMLLI